MKENLIINLLKENLKNIDEVETIIATGSLFEDKYKINCTCICNTDNIISEKMQEVIVILEAIKSTAAKKNIIFNFKVVSSSYQKPKNYKEENIIYDKHANENHEALSKKRKPLN